MEDVLGGFLGALARNGQCAFGFLTAYEQGRLTGYVQSAEVDSYLDEYCTRFANGERRKLEDGLGAPVWTTLSDASPPGFSCADWREARALYLFTGALSPVRTVGSAGVAPYYKLPIRDEHEIGKIQHWAKEAELLDDLWLQSGSLEIEAYRELAEVGSGLNVTGRKIAGKIEQATGKPTYYYLPRRYGLGPDSPPVRCPGCGAELEATGLQDYLGLRCTPCRLLTENQRDLDEPELAAIGLWSGA